MGQVIQIDEARIRDHLGEMVRGTVEEMLNALLDAEADRLCGAGRYERKARTAIALPDAKARSHDLAKRSQNYAAFTKGRPKRVGTWIIRAR